MDNQYVLATYDILGKQDFIYRSSRMKEIVGGSALIRNCYEKWLYPEAEKAGRADSRGIFRKLDKAFARENFTRHMEEGYIGEVIYEGGGNFLLLFKNAEVFREVTWRFSKAVLENTGSLRVLGTFVGNVDFDNFPEDRRRLYEKQQENEDRICIALPWGTLPVVAVDPRTSQPVVEKKTMTDGKGMRITDSFSRENQAKLAEYGREEEKNSDLIGEKVLDNIVRKKGENSLLAVVYIDGNNMSSKVKKCTQRGKNYEECVGALRELSEEIRKNYVDDRMRDIDKALAKKHGDLEKRRFLIYAGDEITLICNAYDAWDCIRGYMENLPRQDSVCAGIAVFYSHAPYPDVYRIAEACCESGKKFLRSHNLEKSSLVDFHYCKGSIGLSLDEIWEAEYGDIMSKPWVFRADSEEQDRLAGQTRVETVEKMGRFFKMLGNGNVKKLGKAAYRGTTELNLELARIRAHSGEEKKAGFAWLDGMDETEKRNLIFDVVSVYDIWFSGGEEKDQ